MQRLTILILAVLAIAFAQGPNQSYQVTPLSSGVTMADSLGIQGVNDYQDVKLYSVYVPENVTGVYYNFTFVSGGCSYLYINLLTGTLPCYNGQLSATNYLCAYNVNDYISSSYDEYDIFAPGYSYDLFEYVQNGYWYFGVNKYSSYDFNDTCLYTITATFTGGCPSGQVGIQNGLSSSTTSCNSYTNGIAANGTSFNGDDTSVSLFKVQIPVGAGTATFVITTNSSYNYIYGRAHSVPGSSSSYYDCYTGTDVGSGPYTYTMTCYAPRSGDFWVAVVNDYDVFTASISYSVTTCGAGMGGIRCDAPASPMSPNISLPINLNIVNNGTYSYTYNYFYLDIPVNYSANPFSITASSSNSGYLMLRREGWPDYSAGAYESYYEYNSFPATFSITGFDYGVPGRLVFGVACYTTPGCNITISGNFSTSTSTTSGSSTTTTGSTTTTATTTTTTTTSTGVINTSGTSAGRTTNALTSGTSRSITSGMMASGTTGAAAQSSYATILVPSFLVALVAFFL